MTTAANLLDLKTQRVFKKPVMDAIIEQFVPDQDAFKITDAFLPMKNVEQEEMTALVKGGVFGTTAPVALSADHARTSIRNLEYREYFATGHWREAILWDEETLTRLPNPVMPDRLWGEGLMAESLEMLDGRLNNLIELLSAKVVGERGFTIARNGVNYSYTAPISPRFYQSLSGSKSFAFFSDVPWKTPAATAQWDDLDDSTPLKDIRQALQRYRDLGFEGGEIWMRKEVANYIEDNANTDVANLREMIVNNQAIAQEYLSVENLILGTPALRGLQVVIDDRRYLEETVLTAAVTAGANTISVSDTTGFEVGDTVILRDSTTAVPTEEELVVSVVSPSAKTIQFSTNLANSYPINATASAIKFFMRDDQVWLRPRGLGFRRTPQANWVSTPSLVNRTGNNLMPRPGRYTWSYVEEKVPIFAEVGAGISGGPVVWEAGNWYVLEVV